MALSWKFVLCVALLAAVATAQVTIDPSGVAVDATEEEVVDYEEIEVDYEIVEDYDVVEGDYDYVGEEEVDYDAAEGDYDYAGEGEGDYDYAGEVATGPTAEPTGILPISAAVPGPAPTPKLTIGALVGAVCPGIGEVLAGDNFSTLLGFLTDPEIAATEITLPEGVVVVAAPTNSAFEKFIAAVGPAAVADKAIVTEVLANHIATAANASESFATTLSGDQMGFWTLMGGAGGNPAPTPTGIAALVASNKDGVISDTPVDELAKVAGGVACTAEGQYAFAIDTVLVPEKYTPKPAAVPASAPASAPAPAPSAGFKASAAFAAIIGTAAVLLV